MIELALTGIAVAAIAALAVDQTQMKKLRAENAQLKNRLAVAKQLNQRKADDMEAQLNKTIGQLQMAVFQRDELICDMRQRLKRANALLHQKWAESRGEAE